MNTKQTILVATAVSAIVLSAHLAHAQGQRPLIVTEPTGTVRIQQALPCGDPLDGALPIAGGRIEVTPASVDGQILFNLTRLDLFVTPFSVRRACLGVDATAAFSEIGITLASGVTVPAQLVGTVDTGVQYQFTIPKDQFLIHESVLDNVRVQQPERAYQKPSEDVTGVIDLRNRTIAIHVALASQLHFRAGCVGDSCVIDTVKDGTQIADIRGSITPPTQDSDDDGIPDVVDNCPQTRNPSQAPVATPVLTVPPDVTLHSCLDRSFGTATATDICSARRVLIRNNAPAQFAVGRNLVTWFGNDGVDPIVTSSQTVTIVDTTAPTVSCTVVNPTSPTFQVAATDDCAGTVSLRLGSYTLANGEVIQINQTGVPGVRLVRSTDGIRHFLVGRGQGVITATDAAGNGASAVCSSASALSTQR
jgi:hypothetical protein